MAAHSLSALLLLASALAGTFAVPASGALTPSSINAQLEKPVSFTFSTSGAAAKTNGSLMEWPALDRPLPKTCCKTTTNHLP